MNDLLQRILQRKREEVEQRLRMVPLVGIRARAERQPPARGFAQALQTRIEAGPPAVIAQIKQAIPGRGVIRPDFDPVALARSYQDGGAAALSVQTDVDFFHGSTAHLRQVRDACRLPVLRDDFIIDPYQVYEARVLGADCIALIVAALDERPLAELSELALSLGMDVLLEVHDIDELERAIQVPAPLLSIGDPDPRTFEAALETMLQLCLAVPADRLLVGAGGIANDDQVQRLRAAGVQAFLIGERLLRAADPGRALQAMLASA